MMMTIGVLALQGAFIEHRRMLDKLGVQSREIRQRADWTADLAGLILPGGESTVMRKLLRELDLLAPIRTALAQGMPVFGTCAGMILLSQRIAGTADNAASRNHGALAPTDRPLFSRDTALSGPLGVLDTTVVRNAYGRQLGSFRAIADFKGIGTVPAVFIRAPYFAEAGPEVDVLAELDGKIVAVRQANVLAMSFHPELTDDTRIHAYFLYMVQASAYSAPQATLTQSAR
jgi:5'-phosphate synthase pdxT subunit